MGAGSSSAASKSRHDAPSSRTFAVTQTSMLSAAHALRIQELEAQVRELKAALAPAPSPLHVSELAGLYSASIALSALRRNEAHMTKVFDRHKDAERGIEREDALIAALREVDAPVLMEQTSVSRLADTNMNGYVGFDEFMRVAQLPDELEKLLQHHNLSALAPALRETFRFRHVVGDNPLCALAKLSVDDVDAAFKASIEFMKEVSHKKILEVHATSKEWARPRNIDGKYILNTMSSRTLAEFRAGLASRIGPPNANFEAAMAAEHCSLGGYDHEFISINYRITTTPQKEWLYIVGNENGQRLECPESDMGHGRHLIFIHECMQEPKIIRAGLNRAEVIALVMYSGPMFTIYNAILRRFPLATYEKFEQAGNRFSSSIFALVSAVVKLSRVGSVNPGTKFYRGMGGTLQLPDSFHQPDEFGICSYVEEGFNSCTADFHIAFQYSGAKDWKPHPTVLVFETGAVDRPCEFGNEFSQYPNGMEWIWPPFSVMQPSGDAWVELHDGAPVTMIPVRVTVPQFETVEQIQERKKGEHENSFRTVISNTIRKLEREASDPDITEQQRALKVVNTKEITVQMQAVLKRHQELGIQYFVDDRLYRDVMTEMLNSTELTFMGRFILKGDQHEYKSATCAVFIATDVEGDTKSPVALKFMKHASEFEQEKMSRLKLKAAAADDMSAFVVDVRDDFDCSHEPFRQSLSSGSNFVINSNLQDYPSLIVMPAADRNLRAIMDNERITDPAVIKRMFHEIVRALKFMHDRGVIHGDVKPRNLVRVNGHLVIIDLDASAEIGRQYSWSKYSSAYLPPEAIDVTVASDAAPASAKVRRFASGGSNACACMLTLTNAAHPAAFNDEEGCVGACGLAHRSHDIWSLGVLLYRFSARESLFSENDDDNIKEDSGHLMQLAEWTPKFKDERLQKIDDTATRKLVAQLLQRDPRMRPASIDAVLAMPFNEMDIIKLKLEQMVPHDESRSSNLVGSVNHLRTGKFSDAAHGLRSYLKVAESWDEKAACTLKGMEDEVDSLKDCPDCAQVQAAVLLQMERQEASNTVELQKALALLRQQRQLGQDTKAAGFRVKAHRSQLSSDGGWHYGLPNTIAWPQDSVQVKSGTFIKTFCQPMCRHCQDYCLDYSSIFADLNYIIREAAVEQKFWNGVRDLDRAGHRLEHFMQKPQAKEAKLTEAELVALRFYTSHSFESINKPMRDMDRVDPHPLPGIVTNVQEGLKKLRTLGSSEASSKQTVVLWRGMSAMKFSDEFSNEGGTELAPMSTTTDVSVAISYAIKRDTRSALLFRFVTRNNLERGADVQWLSMFPGESETLFPPLTFIQKTRSEVRLVEHDGVTVSIVELSTTVA